MKSEQAPLKYYSLQDVDLVDHAWRVGARNRDEVQRSIEAELEAYRARGPVVIGGAVLSLT